MNQHDNRRRPTVFRRGWFPFVAGGLSMALLSACGSSGEDGTAGERSDQGQVSIAWYGSDVRNLAVQAVVDAFGEENPDVDLETQPTTFGGHWDRTSVQAAGNNMPCVVAMQSRYQAKYEDLRALRPLDEFIEDGTIDVSGIDPDLVESHRAEDGQLYTIPYGIWFEGAVTNEKLLADHDLSAPEDDWSWENYVSWAGEVQSSLPAGVFPLTDRSGQITQLQAFAQGRGEDLFADGEPGFSRETLIAWFELWEGARADGIVPAAQQTVDDSSAPNAQQLMAQGDILVSSTGDNNISDYQETLDELDAGTLAMGPSPTGGETQVVGTNAWSISRNCANTEHSALFIDHFINSSDAALTLEAQTGIAVNDAILDEQLESSEVPDSIKERIELYRDLAANGAVSDIWPDGTQELITVLTSTSEEVAFGRLSPADAADAFIAEVESALAGF